MSKVRYYTLIGSRETPKHVLDQLKEIATKLDSLGWYVRSGGANGADSCCDHVKYKEIYLPWNNFNGHKKNWKTGYIVYSDLGRLKECDDYCKVHHQYWDNIKRESVKHLHRRNVHQILGVNLNIPSEIVVCYAKPDDKRGKGMVQGGTGTAVSLAKSEGIEVCNLYFKDNYERLINWINKQGENNE